MLRDNEGKGYWKTDKAEPVKPIKKEEVIIKKIEEPKKEVKKK
jgi:hypothetical protein